MDLPSPITTGAVLILFISLQFIKPSSSDSRTNIILSTCNSSDTSSVAVLAQNFVVAMANLSTLVNQNGFGVVDVGMGSPSVFSLVQCFDDLNSTDCSLCFSEIRSILPKCYPKTGGRIFFDGCFGRYENYNFFDQTVDSEDSTICSSGRNSSHPVGFLSTLKESVGRVQSSAPASGGFSVYSRTDSNNISVNVLGQCWQHLSRASCSACLLAAASSIVSCSPALEGRALNTGCYLRYSDKVFWNPLEKQDSSGVSKIVWISIAVSCGVFLFITAIFIRLFRSQRLPLLDRCFPGLRVIELPPAIALSKLNFKYNVLKKATDNFSLLNKLGQGSFGSVYKGVLPDGREVAVKRLFLNTKEWIDQFFNEVDLISQVHHKNLVKLLGCSLDGPESLLIYEYYYNKSLDFFIFDEDLGKLLDWKRRVDIILGVAEGLCYLHEESEVRVVHRDIKASNILLDDSLKAKITDFGLARSFAQDQTHMTTGLAGTLGYMAPEYIVHGHLTEKADVYSFGILILEIVTGQRCSIASGEVPAESLLSKVWKEYNRNRVVKANTRPVEIIDRRIEEEYDKEEFWRIVHIGLLCTQAAAGQRPPMSKVVELMRGGRDDDDEERDVPTEPPFLDVLIGVEGEDDRIGSMSAHSAPMFPKSGPVNAVQGR